jgi:hypothetical protein
MRVQSLVIVDLYDKPTFRLEVMQWCASSAVLRSGSRGPFSEFAVSNARNWTAIVLMMMVLSNLEKMLMLKQCCWYWWRFCFMEEARGVILTLLWLWWLLIKPIVDLTHWLWPCCRFPDSRMTALTPSVAVAVQTVRLFTPEAALLFLNN